MSIKHKIKLKSYRGRGTSSAELRYTGPKLRPEEGSVESSALDGESARRSVPSDDRSVFKDKTISNDYKSGGAYKAILGMFAEQLDDEKFAEHCRKFFKGENEKD